MRTIALRAACLGLIIAGGGLIAASARATGSHHQQNQSCSLATLDGFYVFSAEGFDTNTDTKIAVAGYEIYDGHGNFSGVVTISEGGNITSNAPLTGTYAVNHECSFTETINNTGQHFDLFVMPSGKEFRWIETDPGSILSGDERRSDE